MESVSYLYQDWVWILRRALDPHYYQSKLTLTPSGGGGGSYNNKDYKSGKWGSTGKSNKFKPRGKGKDKEYGHSSSKSGECFSFIVSATCL